MSAEDLSMARMERSVYPPESYSPWWWLVVALCLLGMLAVLWWARRALRTLDDGDGGGALLEKVRGETLARIDGIAAALASGDLTTARAAARLSAEVRRFAGTVTNGNADYLVLPELRRAALVDARLEPVVAVVAGVESTAFAPSGPSGDAGLAGAFEQAREVVRQWA
ncbi:hypothetical protein KVF89_25410 [Nocardioides carbamazepini]|uniref:hypothetical protein n=1 Tax=Nocardioides carbamazepini TaxID=2854259 RepID=UPI002149B14F|nr:hypothetical protein [Nocardioides carbamazepini]MCR1785898.1 hypothetical protein [Nocardioides carbamazepini]